MDKKFYTLIQCDLCGHDLELTDDALGCTNCGRSVPLQDGKPIFSSPPPGLQVSKKIVRGPEIGTPWRQANWRFLAEQVAALEPEAVILDVGAGRGDFADLFEGRNYLALDVYPYPEVDIVCDLTRSNPFRAASLDTILLMNVLEHVYDTHALLASLVEMLKADGTLLIAIPFLVKMHQEPVDFVRYTHYALERMGAEHGLALEHLEGFYDPISLLGEGTGNIKHAVLPNLRGFRHYAGRLLLLGMEALSASMRRVVGEGQMRHPQEARSHAPTGYHVIYRKKS